jgi:large subunit ribosomal protein L24e
MPKCSFSGDPILPGTGTMYVLKDGKILWFKNSKCLKNYIDLKRKPLKIRWTGYYKKENKKVSKKEAE